MLAEEVRALIQQAIPNTDALEVLMFLVTHPGRCWSVGEVITALHSQALNPSSMGVVFARLESAGLGTYEPDAGFTYQPGQSMVSAMNGLVEAYRRQPVTLIRTVYEIAESARIRALADAFRIKKDPS
jgi:hypothetical protein